VHIFHIGQPYAQNYSVALHPPTLQWPFGTDALGRDVFLRTIYATLTDLKVGAVGTAVPLVLGIALGVIAGYSDNWVGAVLMRGCDFIQAFPGLVLILLVVAIMGPGLTPLYVGFVITGTPGYLRIARSELLVLREQEFILAARTLGFSTPRILVRHALPHVLRPNLVLAISEFILTVLALATLSYLGLGVQPPTPEWGAIIAEGQQYLFGSWWISTLPGLFVVLVGLGFSMTGEALAERLRIRVTGRV
jgi:peptide/nickel transport system permease protein